MEDYVEKYSADKEELLKPITWQELKDFVNSIDEVHLQNEVIVQFEDETIARNMQEPYKLEDDIYVYDGDWEQSGTLKEIKQIRKDGELPFDMELCRLATKKGMPFLWME